MNRIGLLLTFACLTGMGTLGCSLSDADRCPAGFEYQKDTKVCALIADAAPAATEDAAPAASVVDAGSALESEAGTASGPTFGDTCATNAECVSPATDYCVMLPGSTSGYCSKAQCTTECPTSYQCCNCPAFSLVVCLKDADAAAAAAAMGCSCS